MPQAQLKSMSRYKDEQYDQAYADQYSEEQDHHCAFIHELANVGFSYA